MIVHYCDYASQPDIHIVCDDRWTLPAYHQDKLTARSMIFLDEDQKYYTFDYDKITCDECKQKGKRKW